MASLWSAGWRPPTEHCIFGWITGWGRPRTGTHGKSARMRALFRARSCALVKEVGAVEGVALHGAEASVADDAAQFLFGGAVGGAGGLDYVFFEHDRADIVAAEAQTHLADLQTLGDPAGLHVGEVGEEDARDGESLQVLDGG